MLLALPVTARAATGCSLLRDRSGDAWVISSATGRSVHALDIRSVEVGTTSKSLVVVLRLATTNAGGDPATALGAQWDVSFTVAGVNHGFSRRLSATGAETGSVTVGGAAVPFTMHADGGAVTWTVQRAKMKTLAKRGTVLTGFFSQTSSAVAHDYAPDDARASNQRYVDGQRGCARVK